MLTFVVLLLFEMYRVGQKSDTFEVMWDFTDRFIAKLLENVIVKVVIVVIECGLY